MQQQPFLLQALAEKGHSITAVSQKVKLYQLDLFMKHEKDGNITIVLSPVVPTLLKHIEGISSASKNPTLCAFHYEKLKHEKMLTTRDEEKIIVTTDSIKAPPLLETIGNIAKLHNAIYGFMTHASAAAVRFIYISNCLYWYSRQPRADPREPQSRHRGKRMHPRYIQRRGQRFDQLRIHLSFHLPQAPFHLLSQVHRMGRRGRVRLRKRLPLDP